MAVMAHSNWPCYSRPLLDNLKSILGLSTLALLYIIGSCRNEETIDNENAFNLEEKHYDIPAMYSQCLCNTVRYTVSKSDFTLMNG
jgi:hypothetical protein